MTARCASSLVAITITSRLQWRGGHVTARWTYHVAEVSYRSGTFNGGAVT